jgi:hypothetical protein
MAKFRFHLYFLFYFLAHVQAQQAFSYLISEATSNKQVQFIVKTQLLLRPHDIIITIIITSNPSPLHHHYHHNNFTSTDPSTPNFTSIITNSPTAATITNSPTAATITNFAHYHYK